MLLKIITNRNTTKVIPGIEDVEIHDARHIEDGPITDFDAMQKHGLALTDSPHFYSGQIIDGIQTFDSWEEVDWQSDDGLTGGKLAYTPRYVDYLKQGQWTRVALAAYGYLCNDEGKTIAKIG